LRMVFVVVTGLALIFVITVSWYTTLAIVTGLLSVFFTGLSGDAQTVATLTNYAAIVWGPIFDFLIVMWMIGSAQARDVESEMYG
jgi:hypothetical protein